MLTKNNFHANKQEGMESAWPPQIPGRLNSPNSVCFWEVILYLTNFSLQQFLLRIAVIYNYRSTSYEFILSVCVH